MTLQLLKYVIAVAEAGSITKAAKDLFISQPSLSNAIKEIEQETGKVLFHRNRNGVVLTQEGMEFAGYARRVLAQMEELENRFIEKIPAKTVFGVSTQHYTFAENAFVELVHHFEEERYEFFFNEAETHRILEDVKNRISNLGIIYLSEDNEVMLMKYLEDYALDFHLLFRAQPHAFLRRGHPLAVKTAITLEELSAYPRINFVQGSYESPYFSEEMFSTLPSEKQIRVNDRGAVVRILLGIDAYTISSGIFPKYLHGDEIVAVPLADAGKMRIGYITIQGHELSELETRYLEEVKKYTPSNI